MCYSTPLAAALFHALFIHRPSCSHCTVHPPPVLCPVRSPCRGRRGAGSCCPTPRQGPSPPPRGGVQGRRLGADGYSCPLARAIFVFIVVFLGRGLAARPHRLFDLRRHGRRRTSPLGGHSAQRPPPPTTPTGVISWSRLYSATP
jgi:hypothetical protein